MSVGLPIGWASAPLNDIVWARKGKKPKVLIDKPAKGYKPYLLVEQLEGGPARFFTNDPGITTATEEDVLVVWDGSIGKCGLGLQGAVGSTIVALKPIEIEPGFLELFIKRSRQTILETSRGTGLQHINQDVFWTLEMPIAPSDEQKRIVTKLSNLSEKVESCQIKLARAVKLLKRFRHAVLVAAYSGRLTADWREENANIEAASTLLTRIRAQRLTEAKNNKERSQIQESFTLDNTDASRDNTLSACRPESWAKCRIGSIGTVLNGSTPSRTHPEYWNGDIAWVSSGEVRNNIVTHAREYITKAGFENSPLRLLPRGTVLLAMIGEGKTRGQTAILDIQAAINQNIAALLLTHGLVQPEYVWRWFQFQYEATRERGSGSGPQAQNCQRVRELPFILPPLPEQVEITRRITNLVSLAENIEARLTKSQQLVRKIVPSLMSDALSGKLVPQNPKDEHAEKLLERIRIIKKDSTNKEKGRRKIRKARTASVHGSKTQ